MKLSTITAEELVKDLYAVMDEFNIPKGIAFQPYIFPEFKDDWGERFPMQVLHMDFNPDTILTGTFSFLGDTT